MGKNFKSFFAHIIHKIGMDGAIAYSSAGRIVQAVAGVLTLFFIATFLTGDEQGFFYTFGSITAIQIFFELGFTGVITQYVAHEAVYLKMQEDCSLSGDETHKSRLAYLMKFCVRWYVIIAVAFFITVYIIGIVFFNSFDKTEGAVTWWIPWLLISIGTSLHLLISPFTSLLTGLGKVKEMNRIIFIQQTAQPIILWTGLACDLKLYVVGFNSLLLFVIWAVAVFSSDLGKMLIKLWKSKITEKISYMKEIFPYQWRIALSWISGYFIYQLFNPVLFATEGATVAGQMGITLSILNAIQAFSLSWQNTKVPLYSGLIALKKYDILDSVFDKTLKQMISVCSCLVAAMFACFFIIRHFNIGFNGNLLGDRFLGYLPTFLMMISMVINQFVNSWATYLRCHKQEPFLALSITMGILCCLSTFLFGKYFGLYGIVIGYSALTVFVSFPWGYRIFKNKKDEWHKQ